MFSKKPGRPSNNERFVRGLSEGITEAYVRNNSFASAIDSSLQRHTGQSISMRVGSGVRNMSSRLK